MIKLKIKYTVFICLCLIITLFNANISVYASTKELTGFQTRFTHINSFENTFDISNNGQASVVSYLIARNVDSVEVIAKLQQYKEGYWRTVKYWSESKEATSYGTGGNWYVASGYQYRMVSYGYTYENGTMVESTSYISANKFY